MALTDLPGWRVDPDLQFVKKKQKTKKTQCHYL